MPIPGQRLIRRSLRLLAAGLLTCAALAPVAPAAVHGGDALDVRLRVMTLNIFYGGDELDLRRNDWCARRAGCTETFERVVQTIRASGADVVGIEEGEGSTGRLARALGWHASPRLQVISRYRLIDPPGADGLYVFVELGPGEVVAIANSHLPSDPYGPYLVRDGGTAAELDDLERSVRLPAAEQQLDVLPDLTAAGIPVFVPGDYNSPSHLDWTPAVSAVRPEVPFPFDWPVSRAYADAGFRDSYREAHPDPVAVPGFTWTPGGLEAVPNDVHDRIDWVLVAGPATTLGSEIVGERGGPDVDIGLRPYPTDHRGVVSTFAVEPGEPADFAAPESRRLPIGDRLSVVFHGGATVALVRAGTDVPLAELPTLAEDGTLTFATAGLGRGAYEVVLLDAADAELSRAPFWLHKRGARAGIATTKRVYQRGEPIGVRWWNAPGMRWDWVSVFRVRPGQKTNYATPACRAGYCGNAGYLLYEYTKTRIVGTTTISGSSPTGEGRWPLRPGLYEVRLLLDDGYSSRAKSKRFRIVKPG